MWSRISGRRSRCGAHTGVLPARHHHVIIIMISAPHQPIPPNPLAARRSEERRTLLLRMTFLPRPQPSHCPASEPSVTLICPPPKPLSHCSIVPPQVGAQDSAAQQQEYDFLFDDAIDFIETAIMKGEGEFDEGEDEREKAAKVSQARGGRSRAARWSKRGVACVCGVWEAEKGRGRRGHWKRHGKRRVLGLWGKKLSTE